MATSRPQLHLEYYWVHKHYNGPDSVSNHQPHDCLLNHLFRRRSKKTSKLHVTGLCEGNSPGTGEFPAQMAGYAENVSIWWRHHETGPGGLGTDNVFTVIICNCSIVTEILLKISFNSYMKESITELGICTKKIHHGGMSKICIDLTAHNWIAASYFYRICFIFKSSFIHTEWGLVRACDFPHSESYDNITEYRNTNKKMPKTWQL